MSATLHAFHFLQPFWLLALLALPWLLWLGRREDGAQRALSRLVDPELLPHVMHGRPRSRRAPSGLLALGWLLATLALAGPTWHRVARPLYADRAAQVIAISLSRSMLARDVTPSRIERARFKAHDLMYANRDGFNGLIGYAGESFVVAPLTSDAHSLDDLLDAMAPDVMPEDGNDAARAIAQGVKLIRDAKVADGSLVLITDTADAAATAAARKAHAEGVRVSVLGVGTPQGGPVALGDGSFLHDAQGNLVLARRNDAALAALANAGGGIYVPMTNDDRDVASLHRELRTPEHATVAAGQQGDTWQDEGPWLLLPLLVVVALGFRRGWLLVLPWIVFSLALPSTAHASGWRDWWQRADQQASTALHDGKPKLAEQLAQDPALRGAAAYRAGNYRAAVQALQQAKGADAAYNLGNALARLGRYPEAIKAYDRALKMNPHNDDARANRKAVEEAMRRQQQQQKKQKQNKNGSGKSSNQSSQGKGSGTKDKSGQPQDKQPQGNNGQGKSSSDSTPHGDQHTPPGNPSGSKSQGSSSPQDAQTGQARHGAGGQDKPTPQTAQQRAAQQAATAKAQQALHQQMNRALARKTTQPPVHQLGAMANDDPLSKLPADVRHTLQVVPDDPGALLRRKFMLEYLERQQRASSENGQP
ncbi:tetratricopeptide repeat protein [Dyella sp. A6]|uniref:tetratricopeptide repeat protein n=1 Tax=Dyella aluminiiresistens TaxID=3069105 RepID=UPI002E7A96BB|nr:tetratricopeptide repeat protein [Dyella sp. A6]